MMVYANKKTIQMIKIECIYQFPVITTLCNTGAGNQHKMSPRMSDAKACACHLTTARTIIIANTY